jgi:hypothetical protein
MEPQQVVQRDREEFMAWVGFPFSVLRGLFHPPFNLRVIWNDSPMDFEVDFHRGTAVNRYVNEIRE